MGRLTGVDVTGSLDPRRLVLVILLAVGLSVTIAHREFGGPTPLAVSGAGSLISARYDPPTSGVEGALVQGDGQLFATHAADPFLRRPEMIRGGPEEQAYRLQRPLYGWLGWAASGGQPDAVPVAVVVVTVASVVALVAGAAWTLARRGAEPALALVLVVAPGALADLRRVGPEALGALLVLAGTWAWSRRSPWTGCAAVVCFGAAGLLRETLLVVPLVLLLVDLWTGRDRARAVARAGLAAAPYVVWVLVLRAVVGAWPEGAVSGRLSVVPFGGLVQAAGSWTAADAALALVVLGTAVVAVARAGDPRLRALVAAHLVLAATLGEPVWTSSLDWGRVLLPMTVFTLVVLAPRRVAAPAPDEDRAPAGAAGLRATGPGS